MSNLLANGVDWLAGKLKSFASSSITYTRGASSVTIAATIGRHVPRSLGGLPENEVDTSSTVVTFDAVDLDFGSGITTPARGDRFTLNDNGVLFTFEVLPIDNERWWKEADAFGKRLEVNAKLVARST